MSDPTIGPAYRIVTARLVLRCWQPGDAQALKDAVDDSLAHLRSFMPWARDEPQTVEEKARLLRRYRGMFDLDQDLVYGLFDREETRVLGGAGLHPRVGPDAREIGYWIRADSIGLGLAREAAGALTRVAFEHDQVGRCEIHCDPRNQASARVAAALGYRHDATLRARTTGVDGTPRDTMIWSMLLEEHPGSRAAAFRVEAYDVAGERLL